MRPGPSIILIGAVVVLLAISGCGDQSDSGGETQHRESFPLLDLTLDSQPGPETIGLLTANDLGRFREAGIGLEVGTPLNPERPIGYVVDGLADIVVSNQPQVVLAREEGLPVVAFGSLVSETTMAMIWLPGSGIDDIADLKGKTIAYPGVPFQKDFLLAVLERAGLTLADVKLKVGGFGLVSLLEEGDVDAIFGGSGNVEGAELETLGLDPVIIPATELGVPGYDELVFVTRRDRIARHPDLYRRLVEVATEGARTAQEDPAAGGEAIVDQYLGAPPPRGIRAGVDATLPLLSESGEIDRERSAELIAWMHQEGMIKREPPLSAVVFERQGPG